MTLSGIVLVNKPAGLSSQQVVSRVKRIFGVKKAGHTGSLDVEATGMLPVCLGNATKLCEYLLESDKTYRTVLRLGEKTETGDKEGAVIEEKSVPELTLDQINAVLLSFLGEREQIPPMYSALKHQGQCLYELARKGISIERKARKIHLYALILLAFDPSSKCLTFEVKCSKGTYIRVLGEDLAEALGTVGHLQALHRVSCAGFCENSMESLETLAETQRVFPIETALDYPILNIEDSDFLRLMQGKSISLGAFEHQKYTGNLQLFREKFLVAIGKIFEGKMTERKIITPEN